MRLKTCTYVLILMLIGSVNAAETVDVLAHSYRGLAGKEAINLKKAYSGQVVLIVNTASKCGYTPQFDALEAIHQKYKAQGFSVLGFPSNDFLGQDPGSEKQIKEFCTLTYGVKFPMFEKVHVKGRQTTALYKDLKTVTGIAPAWNFHKYLIGRDGKVIAQFPSKTKPDSPEIVSKIEAALMQANKK